MWSFARAFKMKSCNWKAVTGCLKLRMSLGNWHKYSIHPERRISLALNRLETILPGDIFGPLRPII